MEVKDIKIQWFGPQTHWHIPAIFINTKIHSYIKRFNLEKQILITMVSIYQRDSLEWSQKQFRTQNQSSKSEKQFRTQNQLSKSEKQSISDEKENITIHHDQDYLNKRNE